MDVVYADYLTILKPAFSAVAAYSVTCDAIDREYPAAMRQRAFSESEESLIEIRRLGIFNEPLIRL